jgi:hypothetical protein
MQLSQRTLSKEIKLYYLRSRQHEGEHVRLQYTGLCDYENTLLLVSYYYNFKSLRLTDDFYHLKQISALKAILESKGKAF